MMTVRKIKDYLGYFADFVGYFAMRFLSLWARRTTKYHNLWLISERKTDARDNAYHFFEYICREHPEINAVYAIEHSSRDYDRAASLGRTVEPNSFEHLLAFACAKVCVSTHIMGCAPNTYSFARLDGLLGFVRTKKVFLQHGVIENDCTELHYPSARLDLFVCTALPEYDFIKNNFGHPSGVVQMLGLCRYDRLLTAHEVKRQILVMPTWRIFLRNMTDAEFEKSDYFREYGALINSERTAKILADNDYELVFYMHYELQKFSHLFRTDNPHIKIATFEKYDVQRLLMESALLITDYSSILFDFAYMKKPAAYFWFDEDEFFGDHYKRGYFNCKTDGFGPVFEKSEPLINFAEQCIKGGAEMSQEYLSRANEFFDFDENGKKSNCEKTYEAIKNLVDKQ